MLTAVVPPPPQVPLVTQPAGHLGQHQEIHNILDCRQMIACGITSARAYDHQKPVHYKKMYTMDLDAKPHLLDAHHLGSTSAHHGQEASALILMEL